MIGRRDRAGYVNAFPALSAATVVAHAANGRPDWRLPPDGSVVWLHVARSAIWHAVKIAGIGASEAVLMPAYHCGVEVAAVRHAGADVGFYRVTRTMTADLEDIDRRITPRTRAIFAIHYFGFPQPIAELRALCTRRRLVLIEDCAHVLDGWYGGRRLGSFGDFAVYSLPKHLPVPDGGILVINGVPHVTPSLRAPRALPVARQLALLWVRRLRATHGLTYTVVAAAMFPAVRMAMRLLRTNARVDAVSRLTPASSTFVPEIVNYGMSSWSRRILARVSVGRAAERRRANYHDLRARLRGIDGIELFGADGTDGVCPMFLPIAVRARDRVRVRLEAAGVSTFVFGQRLDPAVDCAEHEAARYLSDHVLGVPIHQDLDRAALDHVAEAVRAAVGGRD